MDPDLVRRVRSGEYVVDASAVADAILRRGGLDDIERRGVTAIAVSERRSSSAGSAVFVAGELDGPPTGADEDEPGSLDDLA
jgi:hypothetical protein